MNPGECTGRQVKSPLRGKEWSSSEILAMKQGKIRHEHDPGLDNMEASGKLNKSNVLSVVGLKPY